MVTHRLTDTRPTPDVPAQTFARPGTRRTPSISISVFAMALGLAGCIGAGDRPRTDTSGAGAAGDPLTKAAVPPVEYRLAADQTHSVFSRSVPSVLSVESGAVIEAELVEASAGQLTPSSTVRDLETLSFDPIHPMTGPIYVEGAEPGDILAVTLHALEPMGWGWVSSIPGFGLLAEDYPEPILKIFTFEEGATEARFNARIRVPLRPFPGIMGVAPATDEELSTIPPRENGGNMDNPYLTVGSTTYFPVFVEGALFSIGDPHAVQGKGEVSGTAIEAPLRAVFQLEVIKTELPIPEPRYETDEVYAVTAYATTLDEAVVKATRYMIDYLVSEHGLSRGEAYLLASIAGDLEIAEVVDMPHVHVAMHISKDVLGVARDRPMMRARVEE